MTAAEIAEVLGMALSTVSRWLARIGLGKRSRLEPPEPPNRYERKRPGELIHVDVKKLGRILRPKELGNQASFYSLVSRDTVEQEFALKRQLFLCEQGYSYEIRIAGTPTPPGAVAAPVGRA